MSAERLSKRLLDRMNRNCLRSAEVLRRDDTLSQRSLLRIHHLDRLNSGTSIGQICRKNIQGQHNHREVGPRHLHEQFIIARPHFPDFTAVDNRRKGQDLLRGVPENGHPAVAGKDVAVLEPLGWTIRISDSVITVSIPRGVNCTASGSTNSYLTGNWMFWSWYKPIETVFRLCP